MQMEAESPEVEMSIDEVSRLVDVWVNDVKEASEVEEDEEGMSIMQEAWDDVHWGGITHRGGEGSQEGGDQLYDK